MIIYRIHLTILLVRGLQSNRTNRRYLSIRLFWKIFSHKYEDWEVPPAAACKLEVQENWWCSSGPNPKALRTRESTDPSLKEAGALLLEGREEGWPSSRGESRSTRLQLFAPLGLQWVRWGQSTWVRAVLLYGFKSSFLPETSQKLQK